jgi:hypothetical protein
MPLTAVEIRDIVSARQRRHAERQVGGEKQAGDRTADDRRAAEKSDALAPFQLIELHPILHQQWPDWQDIELAKVSQLCVTSRRQATNEIQ